MSQFARRWFTLLTVLPLLCFPLLAAPQAAGEKPNPDAQQQTARLRIELTGGDQNKPVAEASVYIKFDQERLLKDKKIELNLKTNDQGVARSPEIPVGRILIQVVAPGWKTYGEWHEVNPGEQTIAIQLLRPPTKWF